MKFHESEDEESDIIVLHENLTLATKIDSHNHGKDEIQQFIKDNFYITKEKKRGGYLSVCMRCKNHVHPLSRLKHAALHLDQPRYESEGKPKCDLCGLRFVDQNSLRF